MGALTATRATRAVVVIAASTTTAASLTALFYLEYMAFGEEHGLLTAMAIVMFMVPVLLWSEVIRFRKLAKA